jgi:large subunit ribosomal protein L22
MTNKLYSASTVLKYSPQKARLIINVLRGKLVSNALNDLLYMNKGQSKKVFNLIKAACNNLTITESDYDNYVIESIVAEEAQRYYRVVPRARGSANRIRRRFSRIKILLKSTNLDKKAK